MGAGLAAGLGKISSAISGGMVTGKKSLLEHQKEVGKTREDKRRFDIETGLQERSVRVQEKTQAHSKALDMLKYNMDLDENQAAAMMNVMAKATDMLKAEQDPAAVERYLNMFTAKFKLPAISGLKRVSPKGGVYQFQAEGGQLMSFNAVTGEMKDLGSYETTEDAKARLKAAGGSLKTSDYTGHMNMILKKYAKEGTNIIIGADGSFTAGSDADTAYQKMKKLAQQGDVRAFADLAEYGELDGMLQIHTLGKKQDTSGMVQLTEPLKSKRLEEIMQEVLTKRGTGEAGSREYAVALYRYYKEKGLGDEEIKKKVAETLKGMGLPVGE